MPETIQKRFFERLGDNFVLYSVQAETNKLLFVSSGFERIFGLRISNVINKPWAEVIKWLPGTREEVEHQNALLREGQIEFVKLEVQFFHPSGQIKTVMASQYIANDENDNTVIEGIVEDITERVELENTLKELALFDPLTGVFNREAVKYLIENEFSRSARHKYKASILFLDLDCFKDINDKYGHAAGDKALTEFSLALSETIRASDSVGRYGGEEFVILLPETSLENALELAERMRKKTADLRIEINGQSISFTTSIGVATFPDHAQSWKKLYLKVDQAMYDAKHSGRDCVRAARN